MDEMQFKKTVAENIAHYRKAAGMTQGALAQKINYTDKSVSKWERADGLPDAYVLNEIADIFGITLNDLVSAEKAPGTAKAVKKLSVKKKIIPFLSAGLVWLVAAVLYVAAEMFNLGEYFRTWLIFMYAIPISFIVLTVFFCIWRGNGYRCVAVSGIIWGVFACAKLVIPTEKANLLVIVAAIMQVLTILWFYMMHHSRIQKAREKETINSTEEHQ